MLTLLSTENPTSWTLRPVRFRRSHLEMCLPLNTQMLAIVHLSDFSMVIDRLRGHSSTDGNSLILIEAQFKKYCHTLMTRPDQLFTG